MVTAVSVVTWQCTLGCNVIRVNAVYVIFGSDTDMDSTLHP